MKYLFAGVLIFLVFLAYTDAKPALALGFSGLGLNRPFGGLVTTTTLGSVICTGGTGPVTIDPAGSSLYGSYFFPFGTTPQPSSGKWVLGLYSSIPDLTACYTQAGPYRIPYTTQRATLWGVSQPNVRTTAAEGVRGAAKGFNFSQKPNGAI